VWILNPTFQQLDVSDTDLIVTGSRDSIVMVEGGALELSETEIEMKEEDPEDPKAITKREIPPGVEVFEIYGSLFYAAVDQFKDAMRMVESPPKVLILRTRNLFAIDASGLQALEDLLKRTKKDGMILVISGIHKQPLYRLSASGLLDKIGEDNLCGDIDEALQRARQILGIEQSGRDKP